MSRFGILQTRIFEYKRRWQKSWKSFDLFLSKSIIVSATEPLVVWICAFGVFKTMVFEWFDSWKHLGYGFGIAFIGVAAVKLCSVWAILSNISTLKWKTSSGFAICEQATFRKQNLVQKMMNFIRCFSFKIANRDRSWGSSTVNLRIWSL